MRTLGSLVIALVVALPVQAAVRVVVAEDGGKEIVNDPLPRPRRSWLPPVVRSSEAELLELIDDYARSRSLDPRLVRAVVQVESGYDSQAVSRKGAVGLMQLMPATARRMAVSNPYDPEQNLSGGTRYLRHLLDRFEGRVEWALAGYNAGPETVERYNGVPPYPETRHYVSQVLSLYRGENVPLPAVGRAGVRGRKTFIHRDSEGRVVLTTSPRSAGR